MAVTFAFLHHVAAFALFAAVVVEFVLLRQELTPASARAIQRADIVLGVSATILLLVGLARVFHYEKGAAYYFHSVPFIAKLSLFVIAALLSIVPTLEFRAWRQSLAQGKVPSVSDPGMRRLRLVVHLEMVAVVLILLCAALMARYRHYPLTLEG